ncbi:MAG: LytR family transcriptional regulator, partial [Rhodoglobus sp.]|nr:LytR family transcriptional regulator [Rhodoglobus sp.]
MSNMSTVREPDANSPEAMTKRGWWLVVLNFLIPGSAQLLAGSRQLGRFGVRATFVLWGLVVVAVLAYYLARPTFITVATFPLTLWVAQAAIVFYVVLWIILTFDTLRLVRLVKVAPNARGLVAGFSVVLLVLLGGSGAYAVMVAGVTRDTVGEVFAGTTI